MLIVNIDNKRCNWFFFLASGQIITEQRALKAKQSSIFRSRRGWRVLQFKALMGEPVKNTQQGSVSKGKKSKEQQKHVK